MHFAHYLGRACIYGEEWKGKEIEIREGLNQCATHIIWDAHEFTEREMGRSRYQCALSITWDAHVFTERRGKGKEIRGCLTNALRALSKTRLHLAIYGKEMKRKEKWGEDKGRVKGEEM